MVTDQEWATEELMLHLINDEGMYHQMNYAINHSSTPMEAARTLREYFEDVVSMDTPIGKQADYLKIVHEMTKPEDWDINPWGDDNED